MQKAVFLYVTFGSYEQAMSAIDRLMEQRLVACANLFPTSKALPAADSMKRDSEVVVLFKTLHERAGETVNFLQDVHLYDIQCISQANVEVTDSFGEWLTRECA